MWNLFYEFNHCMDENKKVQCVYSFKAAMQRRYSPLCWDKRHHVFLWIYGLRDAACPNPFLYIKCDWKSHAQSFHCLWLQW